MRLEVSKVFTTTPGGRFISDGDHSAEEFRIKVLAPLLRGCLSSKDSLIINLDGTSGFSDDFLEEAFGGLVRMGYLYSDVLSCIKYEARNPEVVDRIKLYILEAGKVQIEELRKGKKKW